LPPGAAPARTQQDGVLPPTTGRDPFYRGALRGSTRARPPEPRRDSGIRRPRSPPLMVLDTSAILAILLNEPEIDPFSVPLESDSVRLLSAASLVESSMVIEARYGEVGRRELDLLLQTIGIEIVALDAHQAEVARHAFRTFGKGRHAAGLNFGDCFSY